MNVHMCGGAGKGGTELVNVHTVANVASHQRASLEQWNGSMPVR